MQTNNVIYHYEEKKMGPFGWILISYIITSLFLLSIAMIMLPVYVISTYNLNMWTILLLILIPFGGWLSIKIVRYARGLIWHNNHLTAYSFYADVIQLDQWKNTYDRSPTTEKIALTSIQKIVAAPYITNEYRDKYGGKHIDSSYIIYIIHHSKGEKELFKFPFPDNYENMNIWLTYFKEQDMPVQFTTEVLFSNEVDMFTDEQRLDLLENNIHTVPLPYNKDWKQQQQEIHTEWNKAYPPEEYPIEIHGEEKSMFRPVSSAILFSFALIGTGTFGLIKLSEGGWFAAGKLWPNLLLVIFTSFLFFLLLRRFLRWYFILIFIVTAFVSTFLIAMSYVDTSTAANQVVENALGVAIFFPLIVWIPYLIVKATKK